MYNYKKVAEKMLANLTYREYVKAVKKSKKKTCLNCSNFKYNACTYGYELVPCSSFSLKIITNSKIKSSLANIIKDEIKCEAKFPKIYVLKKTLGHYDTYKPFLHSIRDKISLYMLQFLVFLLLVFIIAIFIIM